MKLLLSLPIAFLIFIIPLEAATVVVKKSKTNICHAPGSKYYKQTKYYKSYKNLKDCLESGGRLPKR